MKFKFSQSLIILFIIFTSLSCGIKDKKTSMEVKDPDRHYYPIARGEELELLYVVQNTGANPLFITNIQTSCGCVVVDESSFKVLPSGEKGFIRLKYDSNKNIGYVKHYITIYGNFESVDKHELTFDLHVVPNALYTKDYEEIHNQYKDKMKERFKDLSDGKRDGDHLGYYTDDNPPPQ